MHVLWILGIHSNLFWFFTKMVDSSESLYSNQRNKYRENQKFCFGCLDLFRNVIFPILFTKRISITASIFFAFYFLQNFFAKLVFFANKKQKKTKKNLATYIIIQVHLNYSEKYFSKIYSKLWPIFLKFLIKLPKKWIFL